MQIYFVEYIYFLKGQIFLIKYKYIFIKYKK